MSVQENTRLDEQFLGSWSTHDPDQTLSVLADDAIWIDVGVPEAMRDRETIRNYIVSWFTAFPDLTTPWFNRVVSEDQVATEVRWSGTNSGPLQMAPGTPAIPATGKRVNGHGAYFLKVRNGKVVEVHTHPDVAGIMMQLGMVPSPGS